jgi:hypothetical protein
LKAQKKLTTPNIPTIIHEFIWIFYDWYIKSGDMLLPIVPIALAKPIPMLLTLVGKSYARYT